MAVPNVGGYGAPAQMSAAATAKNNDNPKEEFLAYMKQSPSERMLDAWLKRHNMTKKQFDALSDTEKQKIISEIRQAIEEKMKEKTERVLL